MASPTRPENPEPENDPSTPDVDSDNIDDGLEHWDFEDPDLEPNAAYQDDLQSDDFNSEDWDDGLSAVQEENEEEDAYYDEAPPASYANEFAGEEDDIATPGSAYSAGFAMGNTPISARDLLDEIEAGSENGIEYDEAPPESHQYVFQDDSSEENYILEENDDIITDAAPPEDYQIYYRRFVDEDEESEPGLNFVTLPESRSIWDRQTLMGKVIALGTFKHVKTVTSKENKEQAKKAFEIAKKITKIPLGPIWHKVTQTFMVVFFLANICSAIADIALGYNPLTYKLTALLLCVLEQIGLGIMWIYYRNKRKGDAEYGQKMQQYIENILHEVLLYPIIVVSVIGFATDTLWKPGNDVFKWFQLCLLAVDLVNLLWAQCMRMFMIHKFMQDLHGLLNADNEKKQGFLCMLNSPGHILQRAFMTTVGNTVLMFYIVILLGAQEHTDNKGREEEYFMSWRSGILVISLIILPIYSIIIFLLTNSFWVLTIFMMINIRVSTDQAFQDNLQKKYGHVATGAMGLAVQQSAKTKKRLEGMNQMPSMKKALFGLTTPWMIPLILLWQAVAVMPLATLLVMGNSPVSGETFSATTSFMTATSLVYVGLTIVFNAHLLLLAVILDVLIPIVIVCFIFYPISVPILFRREMRIEPEN